MSYINRLQLLNAIFRQPPDSKVLLANVNRQKVIKTLKKTHNEIPRSFRSTDDPIEEENFAKMRQRDKEQMWDIYEHLPETPDNALPTLLHLQQQYPNVPAISNYLAMAYYYTRQQTHYLIMLRETQRKFPHYLFGKIALAEYYLNEQMPQRVSHLLDQKFEIYDHYSSTVEEFHITEVQAFYSVVGRYCVQVNDLARALSCYFILDDVAPNHWATRQLGDHILQKEVDNMRQTLSQWLRRITRSRRRTRK